MSKEFLPNAAGEDVVAGIRTPQPLEEMAQRWPDVYEELFKYQEQLDTYYSDMQVRGAEPQPLGTARTHRRLNTWETVSFGHGFGVVQDSFLACRGRHPQAPP